MDVNNQVLYNKCAPQSEHIKMFQSVAAEQVLNILLSMPPNLKAKFLQQDNIKVYIADLENIKRLI